MRGFVYNIAVFAVGLHLIATRSIADGGVMLSRVRAGSLTVTIFAAPVPLRTGIADLSAMIQTAANGNPILDANVVLHLSKPGESEIRVAATRTQSSNKLLYAANPLLPSPGEWHLNVHVQANRRAIDVPIDISVLTENPPLTIYWPYFIIVPLGVLLFALNQWLKNKMRPRKTITGIGSQVLKTPAVVEARWPLDDG